MKQPCPGPKLARWLEHAGAVEGRRQAEQVRTHVIVECRCGGWHVVPRAAETRGAA